MYFEYLYYKILIILPLSTRIFFFLTFSPFFSNLKMGFVKIIFSIMLSLLFVNNINHLYAINEPYTLLFILLGEALLGILQAYVLLVIFSAFHLIAYFFSNQMGLAYANIFDVFSQENSLVISQFFTFLFLLIFINSENLVNFFFLGVKSSLYYIRVDNLLAISSDGFIKFLITLFSLLFEKSLIISFPILSALFLFYLLLGILAKTSPQINLLMISFILSLFLGFLILYLSFPSIVKSISQLVEIAIQSLKNLLRYLYEAKG